MVRLVRMVGGAFTVDLLNVTASFLPMLFTMFLGRVGYG